MMQMKKGKKEKTYYVDGMHCAACEVLLEKELKSKAGVESVKASLSENELTVCYSDKVDLDGINQHLEEKGYKLLESRPKAISIKDGKLYLDREGVKRMLTSLGIVALILVLFFLLEESGVEALISVNSNSSLGLFFLFGALASVLSCAALVGSLLLSMSKRWNDVYKDGSKKAFPFFAFNLGRLLSFFILGGVLGLIGQSFGIGQLDIAPGISASIVIFMSIIMLILGLQMLDVGWANRIKIRMPKSITSKVIETENFKGKYLPFLIGALTFFLPCGFTLFVQGLALTSASFMQGALIMFFFALGTLPALGLISFGSVSLGGHSKKAKRFNYVAGILVVFFALYYFNAQLNVLGWRSLSDIGFSRGNSITSTLEGDIQILKTTASASGYEPSEAVVKAGIPIRWEINNVGATGCTSGIVSKELLGSEVITLDDGTTVVEIPALEKGEYKYSCWIGVSTGSIEAI